jgi:hypothetical protein
LTLDGLHCVISQKLILFITTAVRTSNPTWRIQLWICSLSVHEQPRMDRCLLVDCGCGCMCERNRETKRRDHVVSSFVLGRSKIQILAWKFDILVDVSLSSFCPRSAHSTSFEIHYPLIILLFHITGL